MIEIKDVQKIRPDQEYSQPSKLMHNYKTKIYVRIVAGIGLLYLLTRNTILFVFILYVCLILSFH